MSKQYYAVAKKIGSCPKDIDCNNVIKFFLKGKDKGIRETEILHYVFLHLFLKEKKINESNKLFLAFDYIRGKLISEGVKVIRDIKEGIEQEKSISDIYRLNSPITFIPKKFGFTKKAYEILRQKGQINTEKTDAEIVRLHTKYDKKTKTFLRVAEGYYDTRLIVFYTLLYLSKLKDQKKLESKFQRVLSNVKGVFTLFTDLYINVYLENSYLLEFNPKKQEYRTRRINLTKDIDIDVKQGKKEQIEIIKEILNYPKKIEIEKETKKEIKLSNELKEELKLYKLKKKLSVIQEGLKRQRETKKDIDMPEINLHPSFSLSI